MSAVTKQRVSSMKLAVLASSILLGFASAAQAGVVAQYDITNFNGGSGPHGLWTNNTYDSALEDAFDNTFDINGLFTINENNGSYTADFVATAMNDNGWTAAIDLDLTVFEERASNVTYKVEGGRSLSDILSTELSDELAASTNLDVDFFTVLGGTITMTDAYGSIIDSLQMENCCAPVFQFGVGANAKNKTEFGASAWIGVDNGVAGGSGKAGHWDLNVALASPVSEPGTLALLGLGVLGLAAARRRVKA